MSEVWIVDVEWDRPARTLPRYVGPFPTHGDAEEWGDLNIVNGSYDIARLAQPYLKAATT